MSGQPTEAYIQFPTVGPSDSNTWEDQRHSNFGVICTAGSRDFHPVQALLADAVNNARSLCKLIVGVGGESFPKDSSGLTALAGALREHTDMQDFSLIDWSRTMEGTDLDPLLQTLSACPHLRRVVIMTRCASTGAVKNLLQLPKDTHLTLETDHWLALADEIRQGHCNIKHLSLNKFQSSSSQDTEAIKAIASAIRLDRNLESLELHTESDLADEAVVVLAEALTVNKTLRKITLSLDPEYPSHQVQAEDELSAHTYDAVCAMLRVDTNLVLEVPLFTGVSDERLFDSRNRMRIEQVLNLVGRGKLLSSNQTTRNEWVDTLHMLNSYSNVDETPEFNVSCLYSVLRSNPTVVYMS